MLAFARALRHIAEHREAAATEVIGEHVSAQPDDDRVADGRLRRLLAVAYVCDERVRRRWSHAELGPSLARQRDVADDLLAARAGSLSPNHQLPSADAVVTTLPLVWSAELAVRAVAAGCASGVELADGLYELAPSALRAELEIAAAGADDTMRRGAERLLDLLPDAAHPPVLVGVLGPLTVEVGGATDGSAESAVPALRRKRVRALLELLALCGPLRRDRIGEVLWPDLDPLAAGRNVRVTLSRLRDLLEPGANAPLNAVRTAPLERSAGTAPVAGVAHRQRRRRPGGAAPCRGRSVAVPRGRGRRRRGRTTGRPRRRDRPPRTGMRTLAR